MNVWRIILTLSVFLEVHVWSAAQQPPLVPAVTPGPATTAPLVGNQPYLQPSTVIQPAPPVAPFYPPYPAGSTVVPLPSQTPGSIFGPPAVPVAPAAGVPMTPLGVEQLPLPPGATAPVIVGPGVPSAPGVPGAPVPPGVPVPMPPNPISVPVVDDDLAWDQIADVVSDYFTISREARARRGEAYCEGRIETAPLDGATVLEPHRMDSVGWFNRWESTF